VEGTRTVRSYLQNQMEKSTYATDMYSLFEDSGLLGRDTTRHSRRIEYPNKTTLKPSKSAFIIGLWII